MEKFFKNKFAEEKIAKLEEILNSKKIDESFIRELISNQKGELCVQSHYYEGNIAKGNFSLFENDKDIELSDNLSDSEKRRKVNININATDVLLGLKQYVDEKEDIEKYADRKKDAEYEYVFIPSFYAFKILSLYLQRKTKEAQRIYGLKNAIYGGLLFILRYIGGDFFDERVDFQNLIDSLIDFQNDLTDEDKDISNFIDNIVICINNYLGKDLILEKRIKNYNESKENYYCINFYKELEKDKNLLLNYTIVQDYTILMHRDVEKDWKYLKKNQIQKAKEKISKTPYHPNNDCPSDSETLKGLKGWFSQRISQKDRLVYKVDRDEKKVYIATVCDHYKNADGRTKSTVAYK